MDDEFDKLMKIFSETASEKEKKLDEIFQKCTEFFDKYKYIIAKGSEEEKIDIQKKMSALREKLKEETEQTQTRLGVSHEEVKALSSDSKNFRPQEWEFLQHAQERLFKEKGEQEQRIQSAKEERAEELKDKNKKKPVNRKSGWMKS